MDNYINGKMVISNKEMHNALRNFGSPEFSKEDFTKLTQLIGACLDNIRANAIEGDFEIFGDAFDSEEKDEFIKWEQKTRNINNNE